MMQKQPSRYAPLLLLFLLCALIGLGVHHPFLYRLPYRSVALAMLLACAALGYGSLANKYLPSCNLLETLAIRHALGCLILAGMVAASAAAQMLNARVLLVFMLIGSAVFLAHHPPWRRLASATEQTDPRHDPPCTPIKPFLICTIISLFLIAAAACTPPMHYDVRTYHYVLPLHYLRHGGFVAIPQNILSCYPLLAEMLHACTLAFDATGVAANLFNVCTGLAVAAGIIGYVQRIAGTAAGVLSACLFLSCPLTAYCMSEATSDIFVAMFFLASMLVLHGHKTSMPICITASLLFGGAMACKYNTWIQLYPAFLLMYAHRLHTSKQASAWKYLTGIVLCWLPACPWLVKNWIFAGNPVAPAFAGFFGSPSYNPEQLACFAERARRFSWTFAHFAHLVEINKRLWILPSAHGTIGMLIPAALLAPWCLAPPSKAALQRISQLALFLFLAWIASFSQQRFLLPLVVLASIAGSAMHAWQCTNILERHLVRICLAIFLIANLAATHGILAYWEKATYLATGLGMKHKMYSPSETNRSYLENDALYRAFLFLDMHAAKNETVHLIGEHRHFYLQRAAYAASDFDENALSKIIRRTHNAQAVRNFLQRNHVRYLLYNRRNLARPFVRTCHWPLSDVENQIFEDYLQAETVLLYQADGLEIYRLQHKTSARAQTDHHGLSIAQGLPSRPD